jgi:hypothetical protein
MLYLEFMYLMKKCGSDCAAPQKSRLAACGEVSGFQTVQARVLRVRAPAVSTGSSVSGV